MRARMASKAGKAELRRVVAAHAFKVMFCFLELVVNNQYDDLICNPYYYQFDDGDPLLCFSTYELIKTIKKRSTNPRCQMAMDQIPKPLINRVVNTAIKYLMRGRLFGVLGGVLQEVPPDMEHGFRFAGTEKINKEYTSYVKLRLDKLMAEKVYKYLIMLMTQK